jgi:hypothetical protein
MVHFRCDAVFGRIYVPPCLSSSVKRTLSYRRVGSVSLLVRGRFVSGDCCNPHRIARIPKIGVVELNRINVMESRAVLGFSATAHKLFISVSRPEVTCITEGAIPENDSRSAIDSQV